MKTEPSYTYTLKVSLSDTRPLVSRRVVVPSDIVLARLNAVIRAAMGWSPTYPYFFIAGDTFYAEDLEPGGALKDAHKTSLAAMLRSPGDRMRYNLHAGEGWEHAVELETAAETPKRLRFAQCTAGERRCPPEFCGGPRRFAELLKALRLDGRSNGRIAGRREKGTKARRRAAGHGQHPFHGWLDGPFDAAAFDLAAANAAVRRVEV